MSTPKTEFEEDLPPLPPLDDDGEAASFDDADEEIADEGDADLDDATSEGDEIDRWATFEVVDEEGGLLDSGDAADHLTDAGHDELLEGAEIGLLEDSDEGDGRAEADDDDLVGDESHGVDDGGAEGTDEDPAAVLAEVDERAAANAGDDDALDEERFDDGALGRLREDREPWPPRADAAWSILRASREASRSDRPAQSGLAIEVREGVLHVSIDGAAPLRVAGCHGVTTATAFGGKNGPRGVVAALHDPVREASAIVLVRAHAGAVSAELIADLFAEDDGDDVRIVELHARARREGGRSVLEVSAQSAHAGWVLRAKG